MKEIRPPRPCCGCDSFTSPYNQSFEYGSTVGTYDEYEDGRRMIGYSVSWTTSKGVILYVDGITDKPGKLGASPNRSINRYRDDMLRGFVKGSKRYFNVTEGCRQPRDLSDPTQIIPPHQCCGTDELKAASPELRVGLRVETIDDEMRIEYTVIGYDAEQVVCVVEAVEHLLPPAVSRYLNAYRYNVISKRVIGSTVIFKR